MKAITITKYGGPEVLQLQEMARPVPKENEVLVKVSAAALNAADWHVMRGDPYLFRLEMGLRRPKKANILGADVAGTVIEVGTKVTRFLPGDEVFGDLSGYGFGACAEFICANEQALVLKPSNITFEEAAATPLAAVTALQALNKAGLAVDGRTIENPKNVLINGASGGVGTFAVQLAKLYGAEVTAVCSTAKVPLALSLGADRAIDYTKVDISKEGKQYDIIIAANGYHSLGTYKKMLTPQGVYVMVGGTLKQMMQALFLGAMYSEKNGRKLYMVMAKSNTSDLELIKIMLENGSIRPVIDRQYPLAEAPAAMRYLEEGHAKGKIVLTI